MFLHGLKLGCGIKLIIASNNIKIRTGIKESKDIFYEFNLEIVLTFLHSSSDFGGGIKLSPSF